MPQYQEPVSKPSRMATLYDSRPDAFIRAYGKPTRLSGFNLALTPIDTMCLATEARRTWRIWVGIGSKGRYVTRNDSRKLHDEDVIYTRSISTYKPSTSGTLKCTAGATHPTDWLDRSAHLRLFTPRELASRPTSLGNSLLDSMFSI